MLDAVWTLPRVVFAGRFWQLKDAAMEPKPFQKPRLPLWIGAAHPNALARAVRLADGFIGAGSQSTAQFADQVKIVRHAMAESGRTGFRIAKRVYITVDDDAGRARRRNLEGLNRFYGYFGIPGLDSVG